MSDETLGPGSAAFPGQDVLPAVARVGESLADRLEPFEEPLLAAAGVLLLVALIGGGLRVREFEVRRVGPVPRLLCALSGTVIFTIFMLIDRHVEVDGRLTPLPDAELGQITVHLRPLGEPRTVNVTGDAFRFSERHRIEPGLYQMKFTSPRGDIDSFTISLEEDQTISLVQTRNGHIDFNRVPTVDHLLALAATDDWQDEAVARDQLSRLSEHKDARKALLDRLHEGDRRMRALAAMALAQRCTTDDPKLLEVLEEVWRDPTRSPFERVRALNGLACNPGRRAIVRAELVAIANAQHGILENLPDTRRREGLRRQAAYYAARQGETRTCVVEALLGGVRSNLHLVQQKSREALRLATGQDFRDTKAWMAWWDETKRDYQSCFLRG